jgi:hypothetical protein
MKLRTVLIMALSLAATGAAAQMTYKSTMPDGRVIYGAKPEPGAKRVDTLAPPPAKSGMTTLTEEEKARADKMAKDRAASGKTQGSVDAARRQLEDAEAKRDAGKEPLPGERLGTAGGSSRLTDDYFARQKSLEDAAIAARKRLDEAQGR